MVTQAPSLQGQSPKSPGDSATLLGPRVLQEVPHSQVPVFLAMCSGDR